MKFIKENANLLSRGIITQFGIGIFSMVLLMAVSSAWKDRVEFLILVSVFSVCFYLLLIYTMMWEAGSKDIIRMEAGRIPMSSTRGIKAGLLCSVPNALLLLLMVIGLLTDTPLYGTCNVVAGLFWESMYYGFIKAVVDATGGDGWSTILCYVVALLPLPLFSHLGYVFGMKNIRPFGRKSGNGTTPAVKK